jgi:Na+-transporting methylmalonyl-CoA/oxaloacetate decarboxylase gamma subunit
VKICIMDALLYSLVGFAMVFLSLAVLMGLVWLMGRILSGRKAAQVKMAGTVPHQNGPGRAPSSAGELQLHQVPERTAALLMAIVADQMEIPLEQLRFRSIREVKEEEQTHEI